MRPHENQSCQHSILNCNVNVFDVLSHVCLQVMLHIYPFPKHSTACKYWWQLFCGKTQISYNGNAFNDHLGFDAWNYSLTSGIAATVTTHLIPALEAIDAWQDCEWFPSRCNELCFICFLSGITRCDYNRSKYKFPDKKLWTLFPRQISIWLCISRMSSWKPTGEYSLVVKWNFGNVFRY